MSSKSSIQQRQDNKSGPGVSGRMPWAQLGWRPIRGEFRPDDGPLRLLIVAPWCPDCVESLPGLISRLESGRTVVIGEFCSPDAFLDFCVKSRVPSEIPLWIGVSEKSEVSRLEARFRQLRAVFGDPRKWGVPTWLEGRLENGVFVAEKFSDPSA